MRRAPFSAVGRGAQYAKNEELRNEMVKMDRFQLCGKSVKRVQIARQRAFRDFRPSTTDCYLMSIVIPDEGGNGSVIS